jgi:deoxyribonuclease-4
LILGAHVPTTGGLGAALETGKAIGADAVQLFTRNQVTWKARPVSPEEARAFALAREATKISWVLSHASYLLNLASPSHSLLEKSREAFGAELERCSVLGIDYLVLHPGAHMGAGVDAGLTTLVESLDRALSKAGGSKVITLLENTAGQGSYLGSRFEELASALDRVEQKTRLGVCLDTCHLFAAGYDIASPEGYFRTFAEFGAIVGLPRLKAWHLNDAKKDLGSRLDRHAPIGEGTLGRSFFQRFSGDARFSGLPMILETPGKAEDWRREIALLRGMGTDAH